MPLGCGGGTGLGLFLRILDSSLCSVRINGCKQKYRAGLIPYTVLLEDGTANTHRRKSCPESCQNSEKRVYLSQRCGFDPLCRWLAHLRRYRGVGAPLYCRYFCFYGYIITLEQLFVNGFWVKICKITKRLANTMRIMGELTKENTLNSGRDTAAVFDGPQPFFWCILKSQRYKKRNHRGRRPTKHSCGIIC